MLFDEPVNLNSINYQIIEVVCTSMALCTTWRILIRKSSTSLFYANQTYEKEGIAFISYIVNQKYIILFVEKLGRWANLFSVGINLQNYKRLEELPFEYTHEMLWITLTHQFNPKTSKKISIYQPTPKASIVFKILIANINPQTGNRVEPSLPMLVALLCIIIKTQVNWTSLALHNMGTITKRVGRNFPRLL